MMEENNQSSCVWD